MFNSLPQRQDMNFDPEQDDSALNDVCKQIVGKLTPDSSFRNNYNCPWEYKCDYDPRRIPQQADCGQYSTWQCSCANQSDDCEDCTPFGKSCLPVYYAVPVLYTSNCSPYDTNANWNWRQIKVAVSCACSNDQDFS